jgi:hypothetical protein
MKKHEHGVTSNTDDVFRSFIGCTVRGLIINREERVLVFQCGWGLTFNVVHGSYWVESPEDVERKLSRAKDGLRNTQKELQDILKLAGKRL